MTTNAIGANVMIYEQKHCLCTVAPKFILASVLSILVFGLLGTAVSAETFQSEEILVSDPQSPVVDPEFEPVYGQFAWTNNQGELWVGRVNPNSGELVPANGRGTLVDRSTAPPAEFYNGPEWLLTNEGPQIVYTKKVSQGYFLAKAQLSGRQWITKLLNRGADRFGPYGSQDRGDSNPRIFYRGPENPRDPNSATVNYWRDLNDPASETQIGSSGVSPGRWIPDFRQLVYTAKPQGEVEVQVFLLDIDSGATVQITHTAGAKKGPKVWIAPDFADQRAMTVVNDRQVMELYVEQFNPASQQIEWMLISELELPAEAIGPYIWNARPFTHAGSSYVALIAAPFKNAGGRGAQTEIWLTGPLPVAPIWRRVSGDTLAARTDPEIVEVQGSPYIYVYRYEASDGSPSGIYKLATGL